MTTATHKADLAAVPAVIEDTTAESFLSAANARIGEWARPPSARRCLVLNTGSAKNLLRLAGHLCAVTEETADMLFLHSTCLMHKFWSCLMNSVGLLRFMTALFCSICYLHQAAARRKFKKHVHAVVN